MPRQYGATSAPSQTYPKCDQSIAGRRFCFVRAWFGDIRPRIVPTHTPLEIQLRDPLSKETRLERRNLLGASAIGIVIVKTGLVPSKISALGIEFSQTDQRSLLLAIAAVISYFLGWHF